MTEFIEADAVLWDFDGTLADTTAKNMAISKQILARVVPRLSGENLPRCLKDDELYHAAIHAVSDWRELYREHFGMNPEEIEAAGPLWEPYQLSDRTPVSLFDGVRETVIRLHPIPQGICSANATRHILQVIAESGLDPYFRAVVGYESLREYQQKPAPDGGVRCLLEMFGETKDKTVVCIGDHVADVMFARGLAERLGHASTVISVILSHSGAQPERWREQPDLVITRPVELLDLLLQ